MANPIITRIQVENNDVVSFLNGTTPPYTYVRSMSQILPQNPTYISYRYDSITISQVGGEAFTFTVYTITQVGGNAFAALNFQDPATTVQAKTVEIYRLLVTSIFKGCCECGNTEPECSIQYTYGSGGIPGQFDYTSGFPGLIRFNNVTGNNQDFSSFFPLVQDGSWVFLFSKTDPTTYIVLQLANYTSTGGGAAFDAIELNANGTPFVEGTQFCVDFTSVGGSLVQGWQDTLNINPNLNQDNTIDGGGYDFVFDNNSSFTINGPGGSLEVDSFGPSMNAGTQQILVTAGYIDINTPLIGSASPGDVLTLTASGHIEYATPTTGNTYDSDQGVYKDTTLTNDTFMLGAPSGLQGTIPFLEDRFINVDDFRLQMEGTIGDGILALKDGTAALPLKLGIITSVTDNPTPAGVFISENFNSVEIITSGVNQTAAKITNSGTGANSYAAELSCLNGHGMYVNSGTFNTFEINSLYASNNSIDNVLFIGKRPPIAGVQGEGTSIAMSPGNDWNNVVIPLGATLNCVVFYEGSGGRVPVPPTVDFRIDVNYAGSVIPHATFRGGGQLQLHGYGQTPANFPDPSPVWALGVDSSGNVVEFTPSGGGGGTVTSVDLSVPTPVNPAFSVSGNPITTSGTLAISANGTSAQYIDGTGALQTFPAIEIYDGNQGIYKDTSGANDTFMLGAPLGGENAIAFSIDRYISTATKQLNISGTTNGSSTAAPVRIVNSYAGTNEAYALSLQSGANSGSFGAVLKVAAIAGGPYGIICDTVSGTGIYVTATSGRGIETRSYTNQGLVSLSTATPPSIAAIDAIKQGQSSSNDDVLAISKTSTTAGSAGIKGSIAFYNGSANSGLQAIIAGRISYSLTDTTNGSQDGKYHVSVVENNVDITRMEISSPGQLTLNAYTTSTAFASASGPSIGILNVDSSGNVFVGTGGTSSPLTTKGDLYTYSTTNDRLPVGTNGQVLTADSTTATGLKWSTPTTGGIPFGTATSLIATPDTYTATIGTAATYTDGDAYLVRFTTGNTDQATLNINGIGAKTLYRNNDGALIGGDIWDGGEMLCIYNAVLDGFDCIGSSPNTLFAYVTNDQGSTITKGQAVYAFGGTGNRMTVKLAKADTDATSAQTIGFVFSTSIAANQKGIIIIQGYFTDLNLFPPSAGWLDGDTVYLSPTTAGAVTRTKPLAPQHLVYLGVVASTSPGSAGRMYVRVQNGYEMNELHDVASTGAVNNDILYRDTTVTPNLWKPASIPTILGYTPVPTTRSISTTSPLTGGGDLSADRTISIPAATSSVNGYLTSTDWTNFNTAYTNRITSLTTTGTSGAATLSSNTLNIPQYQGALTLTTTGTSGAATLVGNTLNIPQYSGGSGGSQVVLASDYVNTTSTGYEDVTGFSFAVTNGKTYKWRATIAYTAPSTSTFSLNGPTTVFNRYRFTLAASGSTNAASNQTSYNQPATNTTITSGIGTADGILKMSASGTVIIRVRSSTIGGITVLAGSVLEYEEVL